VVGRLRQAATHSTTACHPSKHRHHSSSSRCEENNSWLDFMCEHTESSTAGQHVRLGSCRCLWVTRHAGMWLLGRRYPCSACHVCAPSVLHTCICIDEAHAQSLCMTGYGRGLMQLQYRVYQQGPECPASKLKACSNILACMAPLHTHACMCLHQTVLTLRRAVASSPRA
jgi:hypothetical protein